MKVLSVRILFLVFLVLLQVSFFSIIFPWFRAPLFLVGAVVSLTLVQSFSQVLFMVIPLALLFDATSSGAVTWFSLYVLFVSSVTSFLLRRLLLERQGLGLVLYALVAYGAVLLYQTVFSFMIYQGERGSGVLLKNALSTESLLFSLVLFIPIFIGTHYVVNRFEQYLKNVSQRQFRGVR